MEPKTSEEIWEEGCKEAIGEWSCKYIITHWAWKNQHDKECTEIDIWGSCKLDHIHRNCVGRCSKYEEKKDNKPWYKRLFGR